jgi:photosystem II stability/assembly factor-like uncharacterized protein
MKTKKFSLALLFLFLLIIQNFSFAQTAWYTQTLTNLGGNYFNRVQFANNLTGYTCGGHGTLFKTTNGGYNWIPMAPGTLAYLGAMYFINENTGFVGGVEPFIRKTTDGGLSWTAVPIDVINTYEVYNIQFVNGQTGYASSINRFYKTTNAGDSWNTIYDFASLELRNFQFINENTGFALERGYLRKTSNGGLNWSPEINYPGGNNYQCIYFFNAMTGWLARGFEMRKTTDGGVTLGPVIPTELEFPLALKFMNENTGWCVGKHNYHTAMISSTSDATNWINRLLENNSTFYCVEYIDENKVFVGRENKIISSVNSVTTVSPVSNQIPDRYSLKQNYPNPFNPSTKINFDIKNSSFASLKIFDSMGREVETLVNENLSAGSYSVEFNALNITSGIYFYTLSTEGFTETKKMILVK